MHLTVPFFVSFLNYLVSTWIGLVLTLLVASLFLLYIIRFEKKYNENFAWSLIVTMAIATGQYGHYWPVKSALRIFLASLFFFGLHINTAYHSYLINVLTNPRYSSQISTVQGAIGVGMIFEVGENTVSFFEKEDAVSRAHLYVRRFIKLFTIFFQLSFSRSHSICYTITKSAMTSMSASRR